MKLLKTIANVGMIAMLAMNLTACGKKKNGSTPPVATTPGSTTAVCTRVGNQFVISGTQTPCTATCPADGRWTDTTSGTVYTCTAGQPIGNQWTPPTSGGNYGSGYQYGGCSQYEYQYGIPYVPVYMHQYGQYMCVRYDLLQGQQQYQQYQQYGYDYYYSYPPYSGQGCNNQINFGGNWGSVGLCF